MASWQPSKLSMAILGLLSMAGGTNASLSGTATMPMGANLPLIDISFHHQEGQEVDRYTIQSHGLMATDDGFFKVEGPLNCVRFISEKEAIVSGTAMGTAMNHQHAFRVGDRILLAVTPTKVSVASRIPDEQDEDCMDQDWESFVLLDVSSGQIEFNLV